MSEPTNIKVIGDVDLHIGHKVRAINIDKEKGIKAIYCIADKKIVQYLFRKSNGWTEESAIQYSKDHSESIKSIDHVSVDQIEEFIKVIMISKEDKSFEYMPNSPSFLHQEEEIVKVEEPIEKAKIESNTSDKYDVAQGIEIVKIDKDRRMVYGVFLVPEEADHDGDVISMDDVEKVAHKFMADYRTIDEMHEDVIDADIVESAIAWADGLEYYGKVIKKGSWFGGVKVYDNDVWEKIKSGEYKGFSVRISGVRQPIE